MARVVIIGNAGAGKSTLARRIAARRGLRHVEIDRFLWQPGWVPAPEATYRRLHDGAIAGEAWVIDGLGMLASVPARMARATEVILVDMPLWMHFWLAAERQLAWSHSKLEHAPGGIVDMPPTRALFETIWEVDRTWMPQVRRLCAEAEARGTSVLRLSSVDELSRFTDTIAAPGEGHA
jgi:adenylate kinase family enzyme